jgi:hypothetical protein
MKLAAIQICQSFREGGGAGLIKKTKLRKATSAVYSKLRKNPCFWSGSNLTNELTRDAKRKIFIA